MDLRTTFGKNLKYYRFKNNFSQEKLAELADISTNYVSQTELGQHSVDFLVIERLSKALNIEPFQLFLKANDEKLPRRIDMKYRK